MGLVRVCDACHKVIKDRRFVEVGVGWSNQSFHPRDLKDRWDPLAAEVRKHGIRVH